MNLRQQQFVAYYTEGETKGNCYQSMIKAGYKERYAFGHAGTYIVVNSCIQEAIKQKEKALEITLRDRVLRNIDRLQTEIEQTKQKTTLCTLINAQKGLMDMQAKNEGFYAADNAQRQEQAKLTKAEEDAAHKIARIINLGLVPELNDVQGQGQAKTG